MPAVLCVARARSCGLGAPTHKLTFPIHFKRVILLVFSPF